MMPGTLKTDSQVRIKDSCNQCCCFGRKRKHKETHKKVEKQVEVLNVNKPESPRKAEHKVTQIHLDLKVSEEEDVVVMDYKVGQKE